MSYLSTILDPARSAHASIHGYLYQAYLGVERWLQLEKDVVLRCEGDEDLDLLFRDGSGGLSVQVKALTGTVNIRDQVVQETLRRFAITHHRLRAAGDDRTFLFTSTASLRTQRLDERYTVDVLAVWEEAEEDDGVRARVVEVLRAVLPGEEPDAQLRAALAWLEEDGERWADLIRSVEWKLGEPDLDEVRARIDDAMASRRPGAPPNLQHRLLAEVLKASVEPNPLDRCRTREQLDDLLQRSEAEIDDWLRRSGRRKVVQRLDELDSLLGVLFDKPRDLPDSPRPGQLLTAAYEVIPFDETGRREILDDLAGWCAKDQKHLVRLIYGDGGLGKTRLLIEWCRRLAAQGWITGFLEPSVTEDEMARLLQGSLPRLVVIDYAETQLDTVRFLVGRLARAKDGLRVRLVLLARREGDWWRTLQTDAATEDLLESTRPQKLQELLPDLEERRKVFQTTAQAFAHHLLALPQPPAEGPSHLGGGGLEKGGGQEGGGLSYHGPAGNPDGGRPHLDPPPVPTRPLPEGGRPLPEPDLAEEAFGRPLYLHMAALAAAQGQPVTRAEDALARTLQKERQYWHKEVHSLDESETARIDLEEALQGCVVVLTLLGGLKAEAKTQKLAHSLLLGGGPDRAKLLAKLLHRLYAAPAGSGRYLGGLEPDLLGEELVWDALRRKSQLLEIALDLADPEGSKQLLTVLTRLAQRVETGELAEAWLRQTFEMKLDDLAEPALEVAVAQGDPVGPLLAQAIQEHASLELATRIMDRCDGKALRDSVPLREVALHSTRLVFDRLRMQGQQDTDEANTEKVQAELSRLAMHLGNRLSDLGRHEEALQAAQDAVNLYRLLAHRLPKAYLATSLDNLGIRLSDLGRYEEALQATQEATDLYRLLARQSPETFLPDLALNLSNLGVRFFNVRRHQEALQATQQATDFFRLLAKQQPDAFRLDLARNQANLGVIFSALSRQEEALQATQEAADLYNLLANQRPDAFLPGLALSLNNLGCDLNVLGRFHEALQATQKAAEIYRLLARQRLDSFGPNLANCLGNLSRDLSATSRIEAALLAADEGVRMLAPYFLRYPRAFEEWMTNNVTFYCRRCQEAGHEPDLELLTPIVNALGVLKEEPT